MNWTHDPLLNEVIQEAASRNNAQIREDERKYGEASVALRFLARALVFDPAEQRWFLDEGTRMLAPELRALREVMK